MSCAWTAVAHPVTGRIGHPASSQAFWHKVDRHDRQVKFRPASEPKFRQGARLLSPPARAFWRPPILVLCVVPIPRLVCSGTQSVNRYLGSNLPRYLT